MPRKPVRLCSSSLVLYVLVYASIMHLIQSNSSCSSIFYLHSSTKVQNYSSIVVAMTDWINSQRIPNRYLIQCCAAHYRTILSCQATAPGPEKYSHHLSRRNNAALACRLPPWWTKFAIPFAASCRHRPWWTCPATSSSISINSAGVYITLPATCVRKKLCKAQHAMTMFEATSGSYLMGERNIWNRAPITPKAFSEQRRALESLWSFRYISKRKFLPPVYTHKQLFILKKKFLIYFFQISAWYVKC